MAKIIIPFNNKEYSVDESAFSDAYVALKSHLSAIMNGSGATISFGGTDYNIDSAKLSAATNDFITHLGTVAGSGKKVVIGGVEYNVDSAKMNSAIAELETVLGDLHTGNDGDDSGNEYNPNDPALNPVGTIPEGAYYGNLLTGTFYDTTMPDAPSDGDMYLYGDYFYSYTSANNGWTVTLAMAEYGILNFIPNYPVVDGNRSVYGAIIESINGKPIVCVDSLFKGCDNLTVAPNIPNGVTSLWGTFTGCESLTTVTISNSITRIGNMTFYNCGIVNITIPNSVRFIDNQAFGSSNLTEIIFNGTVEQWNAIEKNAHWCEGRTIEVICTDGSIYSGGERHDDIIPEGAYYVNLATGTFYSEMPATVSEGDVFLYGDYMYQYDTRYYSGWAAVLATEELGIGAYLPNYPLTNRFKSSYGTILTSINGVNVTEINELTYSGCINLVSVIIPNSITTIDMQTFIDCKSLESINIPASVTHIYNDAFNNCTSLTTITFGGTTAEWDVIVNALNGSAFSSLIPATTVVCSDGEAPFPKNPAD